MVKLSVGRGGHGGGGRSNKEWKGVGTSEVQLVRGETQRKSHAQGDKKNRREMY